MMKILHTGDWHLGKIVNGYSLLDEQKDIVNKIKDIIFHNQIDVVLICGDVFDRTVPSYEALKIFEDFLLEMHRNNKYVIAIVGNHDGERMTFAMELFKESHIYLVSKPDSIMIDGVCFYMLPFLNIYRYREIYGIDFKTIEEAYDYALSTFNLDGSRYNILLAHDYFTYNMESIMRSDSEMDISLGGSECVDVERFFSFNYVALGHIHRPQRIGRDFIRYSGSILKYSFSEVNHQKSVTVIDTYSGFYQIPLIPKREMIEIKGYIDDLIKPEFYKQFPYNEAFFRVVILNEEEVIDAYAKLKAIFPFLMEIYKEKVNGVLQSKKENLLHKTKFELFKDFYNEVTGCAISDDEAQIVDKYLRGGNDEI